MANETKAKVKGEAIKGNIVRKVKALFVLVFAAQSIVPKRTFTDKNNEAMFVAEVTTKDGKGEIIAYVGTLEDAHKRANHQLPFLTEVGEDKFINPAVKYNMDKGGLVSAS